MMKVLNIVRSKPDESIKKIIDAFSEGEGDKVVSLYKGGLDWSAIVDDIFAFEKIICWW